MFTRCFLDFLVSSFSSLSVFKTVILKSFCIVSGIRSFPGRICVSLCFHLNGPYFPVSLYALRFLFLFLFFFLSLTFETSDWVTLEIRFSFPGLLIFCVFGGFFVVVVVAVVQSEDQLDV